jgi:hypothetical protein
MNDSLSMKGKLSWLILGRFVKPQTCRVHFEVLSYKRLYNFSFFSQRFRAVVPRQMKMELGCHG